MSRHRPLARILLAVITTAQLQATGALNLGLFRPLIRDSIPTAQAQVPPNTTELPQSLYERVLATLPPNMAPTFVIGPNQNPFDVRGTANDRLGEFGLTQMFVEFERSSALRHENQTMRAVCNLFGYDTVQSSQTVWAGDGRSNFTSCPDNHHGVWTGTDITNGNQGSACDGLWTSQIVCSTKEGSRDLHRIAAARSSAATSLICARSQSSSSSESIEIISSSSSASSSSLNPACVSESKEISY